MKKTGKKKIFNFILITLLLLLALFCVGLLYLFFVPNSHLFSITFISRNNKTLSETYHYENVEIVKLNSNRFDIEVVESPNNNVYVETLDKTLGYTLMKKKNLVITSELVNNVATFTITEPTGVLYSWSSKITLYIPNQKAIDVEITNKKANTVVEDSNLNIASFSYTTNSGDIEFIKGSISDKIMVDLSKADCEFKDTFSFNGDLDIKTTSGKVDTRKIELNDINILSNKNAVILINNCNFIQQETNSSGGRIEINKVNTVDITAGDTNLKFNEIVVGANITLTASGTVSISTISGNSYSVTSSIITKSGDISINNCKSSIIANSTSGNITITNAYKYCQLTTESGDITISYAEDADSFDVDGTSRSVYIISTTGHITLNGVENISMLEIKQDGKATIKYNDLFGKNFIIANESNVEICTNMNSKFNFKSITNAGKVKVNFTQTEQFGGWTDKSIGEETPISINNYYGNSNLLSIETTSGNITVLDSNLY